MLEIPIDYNQCHEQLKMWIKKGVVEPIGVTAYQYQKPQPDKGPHQHPRGESVSFSPAGFQPVAGTGRNGWPEHVRRVKTMLKPGVKITRKGNNHIFFTLGSKFTWTSSTPRGMDEEYAQIVRRLRNEGMLK